MTFITGISHVVLTVRDLDRSADWYQKVLSAQPIFRGRSDPERFEIVLLAEPASGMLLGLNKHDESPGDTFDPRATGLDHLAFAVESRDALEGWARHLDSLNIAHGAIEDQPFGTALLVRDPDGIALEFYHLAPAAS